MNPLKELDELYSKDAKVPLIDLEVFAHEHIKSVEETKFEHEMQKLQTELDQLELGKLSHPIDTPPSPLPLLHPPLCHHDTTNHRIVGSLCFLITAFIARIEHRSCKHAGAVPSLLVSSLRDNNWSTLPVPSLPLLEC